ncbi:MAG: hypothetical protein WCJ51_01345 [Candidatus Moraniibacteriota bacterium]
MTLEAQQNTNLPIANQPEKKFRVVLANVDIEQQVRDAAEERLLLSNAEAKKDKGLLKKVWNNVWKNNLAQDYYHQKEIAKVRREIQQSGNLYAGENGERADHEMAMTAIVKRFETEYESENLLRKGEEKRVLSSGSGEAAEFKAGVSALIKSFAGGSINETQFQLEKKKLAALYPAELKGAGLSADNLLEIAKQVKSAMQHGLKLNELDQKLEIVVGKARAGVETEAQYNAVDKLIAGIQKTPVGKFVNETTLASAVAILYQLTAKGSVSVARGAAKLVGPFAMGLSAGIGGAVAGTRENKRLKDERAQHGREMAKGKVIEKDSKRREEMEKYRYETKSAAELTAKLNGSLEALKNNPSEQKLTEVLNSLNEIQARVTFSEQKKVDLISFSDSKKIESERTEMYVTAAKAKIFLKENIQASWSTVYRNKGEFDAYLNHCSEAKIKNDFLKEKNLKDEAFNKMKRRQVAGSVTKGLAVGLGVGVVAQEAHALFGAKSEGLFNGLKNFDGQKHHYTALAFLQYYLAGDVTASSGAQPAGFVSRDATVSATKDFVKDHENLFSKINRGNWGDNDTPLKPDKNELRLRWGGSHGTGIDANGNFVFNVKSMLKNGSFHHGKNWDPQALLKEGKLKLLVSLSGDTQGSVLEIPFDEHGNAIIAPNSEIGMAFENVDGHAKFLGKFAEVAVTEGGAEQAKHVDVLATHIGEGISGIKEIVKDNAPTVEADYDVEAPAVIPIIGRQALEKLKDRENVRPVVVQAPASAGRVNGVIGAGRAATPEPSPDSESVTAASTEPVVGNGIEGDYDVDDDGTNEPLRAMSWYMYKYLKDERKTDFDFNSLNGETEAEREANFIKVMKDVLRDLFVHVKPDLDAKSFLLVMKLAGAKVDLDKPQTLERNVLPEFGIVGDASNTEGIMSKLKGALLLMDHHDPVKSKRGTSATKFAYEAMTKAGLLEKQPYLDRFIDFVTSCDNMDFPVGKAEAIYNSYHKNLYGLAYRMDPRKIVELFKDENFDPGDDLLDKYLADTKYQNPQNGKDEPLGKLSKHMENQINKGKKGLEKVIKAGFDFDTGDGRFGKILIDMEKSYDKGKYFNRIPFENNSNQLEVFRKGYGGYLIWAPAENGFVLYTKKEMNDETLPGRFKQGFNVRGHMWMKMKDATEKLDLTLEQVLSSLAGREVRIAEEPKLEKALKLDKASKEMLSLLDEKKLTKDALQEKAETAELYLKEIIDEMRSQRAKLNENFTKKYNERKDPKKRIFNKELAMDILLELQKEVKTT